MRLAPQIRILHARAYNGEFTGVMCMSKKTFRTVLCITAADVFLFAAAAAFRVLYHVYAHGWMLSVYITLLTTAYHFGMRLLVGQSASVLCRGRKINPDLRCLRIHGFEHRLYRLLNVKKCKKYAITAKPECFDIKNNTPEQLLQNMILAEITHAICMPLSFVPLLLAIKYGAFWIFAVTSLAACLADLYFVIIQRYNRPRVERIIAMRSR